MFFFLFLSTIRQLHKLSVSTKVLLPTVTVFLLFFIFFFFLKKFPHLFKNRKTGICGKSQKLWDRVNTKLRRTKKKGYRYSRKKKKKESPTNFFLVFSSSFPKNECYKKKTLIAGNGEKLLFNIFL